MIEGGLLLSRTILEWMWMHVLIVAGIFLALGLLFKIIQDLLLVQQLVQFVHVEQLRGRNCYPFVLGWIFV